LSYKLLAIDLDDTLLNDNLEISRTNLDALKYALDKGVKLVLCTGRPTQSVSKYIEAIEGYGSEDFAIVFNGSIITSAKGEVIFRKYINKELLEKLVDIGRAEDVDIQIYNDRELLVEKYTNRIKDYENLSGMKAKHIEDLKNEQMSIKVLYNCTDTSKLDRIKAKIECELKNEVFVFYSKKAYLEVLCNEGNKGIALEYLANKLSITREQVIAIGDSENDIYMLEFAGLAICMKNGRETVKAIADYITQNTNNENGVAEAIYKFI
jgi:hypothetical protein